MIQDRDGSRNTTPEDTRLRILDAARELFARKGRRGTTTREVAERAGVNEATLFRHFGNKDALLMACVQHHTRPSELHEIVSNLSGDLRGDLLTIATALYDRMTEVRDLIIRTLAEDEDEGCAAELGSEAWKGPHAIHAIVSEYMARRIATGELRGDARLLAKFFMGMIFSRVIGMKKFPEPLPMAPEEITAFQVDTFLNGVRS